MDESAFFTFLEYRVCDELPALGRRDILGLWCDGLSAERDEISNGRCAIHGEAWMGGVPGTPGSSSHQERWRFSAFLPSGVVRSPNLDWHTFCPPADARGWLEVDVDERTLTIWLSRWSAPTAAPADVEETLVAVRRILWESWDPIGVNRVPSASTEYDSYAMTIVGMLSRSCSAHDLEHHLARLETDSMGLGPRPSSSRASVVAALLALRDPG